MVEHAGTEFRLLTARRFRKAVIHNKRIHSFFRRKRNNDVSDLFRQKGSKTQPVRFRAVQEPIEGILSEHLFEGTGLLLHIDVAAGENITELILGYSNHRNTLLLLDIAFAEKVTDPEN